MGADVVVALAQGLAFVILVAIVAMLALVLRRTGQLIGETRDIESFRRATGDLASRVAISLDGVGARIDAVRRHTLAADEIGENLAAATDAVERYIEEARALRVPPDGAPIRDAMIADLERALRALQMTEHGCSILASARLASRGLEAQTSIKRGYLNLLHAREAVERHAADAAALAVSEPRRIFQRPSA